MPVLFPSALRTDTSGRDPKTGEISESVTLTPAASNGGNPRLENLTSRTGRGEESEAWGPQP